MEKFTPLRPGRYYRCIGPKFPDYQGVIVKMEWFDGKDNLGKVIFTPNGCIASINGIWRSHSSDQYTEISEEEVLMYKIEGD
jgi:hypothetical protein